MSKLTVKIDYVALHGETPAQAADNMAVDFEVAARVTREVGSNGHPEAEISGQRAEVIRFLDHYDYDLQALGLRRR
jgi:hypothetical protein